MTEANTGKAFDKIKRGLEEARAWLDGSADQSRYRVHEPVKPKDETVATRAQRRPKDTP